MFALGPHSRIFLIPGVTDMRKGFDGLRAIIESLEMVPHNGHLFVFANRRRNQTKLLYWDGSGFWVCAKRLQKGTFWWPSAAVTATTLALPPEQLAMLLGGLNLNQISSRDWFHLSPDAA